MASELEEFSRLPVQDFAAGQLVIEQGTSTGRLFILIKGKVEVIKDGRVVATTRHAGDIFGDLSALLDIPHTTSVRAVDDASFHVVTDARTFLEQNPRVSMLLCELLARRLVSVTQYLVNLKEQYVGHDHLGMVDDVLDKLIHRHPRQRIASRSSILEATD
jgi:CRP/FNR family transcriptional regulator, cyclic AMP receptor protein